MARTIRGPQKDVVKTRTQPKHQNATETAPEIVPVVVMEEVIATIVIVAAPVLLAPERAIQRLCPLRVTNLLVARLKSKLKSVPKVVKWKTILLFFYSVFVRNYSIFF